MLQNVKKNPEQVTVINNKRNISVEDFQQLQKRKRIAHVSQEGNQIKTMMFRRVSNKSLANTH